MSQIYTVYYCDSHYDHNLIVRADSQAEAEQIVTDKYLPTLEIVAPRAAPLSDNELEEMELGKKEIAKMDRKGFYLYDHGT
ncbi:hypothetical protein LCGC14_1655440 [marine sediment metagenome]|uniref:Uncharacterized protein n=1 Tax=marine sediment metagenome TaxID=412755 RepID=A0A0F9II63_9ZZZZ